MSACVIVASAITCGDSHRKRWLSHVRVLPASSASIVRARHTFTPQGWGIGRHGLDMLHRGTASSEGEYRTRGARLEKPVPARVWDAVTGKSLTRPLKRENAEVSAAFSPDGTHVVTVSSDKRHGCVVRRE